jgi:hypothetical protein
MFNVTVRAILAGLHKDGTSSEENVCNSFPYFIFCQSIGKRNK